eukprot:CAMPEP_0181327018 /NCGR_PEP_ID=MMETSP1101-20121128/21846_1 /TAXON_ID=46948 /ORGANISM="Rhodomonas abbreviata, Strain Caron Lab Isolate" /LENGTH=506 /DNA_ID=CAMNT_0023435587 /DNA_START=7 /DNA_END=1527 /DNA_ORIENTATION=+
MAMSGRGAALSAVAAVALLCIAMTAVSMSERRSELLQEDTLNGQANFRAVGDLGCIGRKCQLSDSDSRKDLSDFFGTFLDHGAHAGHKTRTFGLKPEHIRLSHDEANKDLTDYYSSFKPTKTAKVQKFEKQSSSKLDKFEDKDSRSDMENFFDTLSTGHGKKQNIVKEEVRQEKAAKQHRLKALAAAAKEDRRMDKIHDASEDQAVRDHERFHKAGKEQLAIQAAGHAMEAVPSSPRTTASERRAEGKYFSKLQMQAKRQKSKNELRHEGRATALHSKGKLSAQEAEDDMNTWYSQLNSKVDKTPKVLKAEEESKSDLAKIKSSISKRRTSKQHANSDVAVPAGHLSREEYVKEQASYFSHLNSQVHKTPRVLAAEAAARKSKAARALSSEEARKQLDSSISVKGVTKRAKVVAAEEQAKEGFEKMKAVAAKDNKQAAKAVAKVPVAVGDARLSRGEARKEQNKYFASLDAQVKKTSIVLKAEEEAKDKAKRQLTAEEARKQLLGE